MPDGIQSTALSLRLTRVQLWPERTLWSGKPMRSSGVTQRFRFMVGQTQKRGWLCGCGALCYGLNVTVAPKAHVLGKWTPKSTFGKWWKLNQRELSLLLSLSSCCLDSEWEICSTRNCHRDEPPLPGACSNRVTWSWAVNSRSVTQNEPLIIKSNSLEYFVIVMGSCVLEPSSNGNRRLFSFLGTSVRILTSVCLTCRPVMCCVQSLSQESQIWRKFESTGHPVKEGQDWVY